MAITWEVTTRFLDKARTRVSVTAVATDSADLDNPITVSAIQDAAIQTEADKTALWANIKAHYDVQKAESAGRAAALLAFNSEAKTGLEKL